MLPLVPIPVERHAR
ncbi:hypothetical protein KIPB_010473, partial [Kipferlia bialata]|eukprot:g10473.t1